MDHGLQDHRTQHQALSIGQSLWRLIGYGVSATVLWVGYLWVLVDNERQAWHDHMAKTWVIYDYERRSGGQVYAEFQARVEDSSE
ncbi:MAG: RDD family protein [Actinomycetia bacterium]|nr:RDD family protein [Actinomycetes bacterium]